jgi:hypothetical protein
LPPFKRHHCPRVTAAHFLRGEHQQCTGKKKGSYSKSKAALVDEEEVLQVIKNQEFIAMRATEKVWPALSTMEDLLRELVSDGLIQDQGLAEWKPLARTAFLPSVLVRSFSLYPSSMLDSASQRLLFSTDSFGILISL